MSSNDVPEIKVTSDNIDTKLGVTPKERRRKSIEAFNEINKGTGNTIPSEVVDAPAPPAMTEAVVL